MQEQGQWRSLEELLHQVTLTQSVRDEVKWKNENEGTFTVRSMTGMESRSFSLIDQSGCKNMEENSDFKNRDDGLAYIIR